MTATVSQPGKSRWYIALSIALAVVFLYLAFRKASWVEIIHTIQHGRIEFLLFAVLISVFNYFLRSQRWGLLLRGEKKIPPMTMFWATGVGYLGNNFLPMRAGEFIRSIVLGNKAGISKVFVITTAFTERVLDAIALVIIGLLIIPSLKSIPDWLPTAMRVTVFVSVGAVVFLLLAPRFEVSIMAFFQRLPLPLRWKTILGNLMGQFFQGAKAFLHPGRAAMFGLMTIVIWLMDGLSTIIAGNAFALNFSLSEAMLLLVGLGLSSAVPSTPGYLGVYQFVAVTVLGLFGFTESQALAYIIVVQALNMVTILIWGLLGLWRFGISTSQIQKNKVVLDSKTGEAHEID